MLKLLRSTIRVHLLSMKSDTLRERDHIHITLIIVYYNYYILLSVLLLISYYA